MPEPHPLREVFGKFVTGVTVVTASGHDGTVGITANSYTSVSLDPPLVLFCVHRSSRVRETFESSQSFAINILSKHQQPISRQFSNCTSHRAEGVALNRGTTGTPLLADALAYLDCDLHQQVEAGDHVIVIGRVQEFKVRNTETQPLAFYEGSYANLTNPEDTDHGLIAPISIPDSDRIPDELTGTATSLEYDKYFRIRRTTLDLTTWTRTCLDVNQELIEDLGNTSLSEKDQHDILAGMATVQDITLSHWVTAASNTEDTA